MKFGRLHLMILYAKFEYKVVIMTTAEIKLRLHQYIETAQESKLKAIYTMVEEEISETYDFWNDEEFVAELVKRENSYLNGTSKAYTLEESIAKAKEYISGV